MAGLRNRKKPLALPRHMTAMEVERLILATPDLRHRAAFIAAYGAGLRVSETVRVKVGDIKPDRKCLHIPSGKGGAERMAPLPDGVIHYLRSYWKNIWPQPATWLFYGASPDRPMPTQALHRAFKQARDKLGIDPRHSFHSLRHSAPTHLLERRADIEVIRDALGHRSADTTRSYRKPGKPGQRKPRYGTATVAVDEFIRHFGILANGCRATTLESAREALGAVGCTVADQGVVEDLDEEEDRPAGYPS